MKMLIVSPFLLALALNLGAQPPKESAPAAAQKAEAASAKSQVKNTNPALPVAGNEDKKAPPAPRKEPSKAAAEQENEEGGVMIDSKAEESDDQFEEPAPPRPAPEAEEISVPGGMPLSFGQLKGTINDGGRSILVFENEEGVIAFVQVFIGKNAVSWKLVSRIRRSMD